MVKHNFWSVQGYLKKKIVKKKRKKKKTVYTVKKKILCKKFAQRPEKWGFWKKKP